MNNELRATSHEMRYLRYDSRDTNYEPQATRYEMRYSRYDSRDTRYASRPACPTQTASRTLYPSSLTLYPSPPTFYPSPTTLTNLSPIFYPSPTTLTNLSPIFYPSPPTIKLAATLGFKIYSTHYIAIFFYLGHAEACRGEASGEAGNYELRLSAIALAKAETMNYEQRTTNYLMQNKPNQTQPVVSLSNLFQTTPAQQFRRQS